ncbi:MAG: hypothetical protein AAGF91_12930 [Actinomycetota bacterium]
MRIDPSSILRSLRRPQGVGVAAVAALAVAAAFASGAIGGGGDDAASEDRLGDGSEPLAAAFAPDATYDAGVSAIFVAVDPTDAVDLIAPAPWCSPSAEPAVGLDADTDVVDVTGATDVTDVVDPVGPCATVDEIATLTNADAVLDCRAEEAAVIAAAEARLDDTGRALDGLDSLIPTYLTERPRHWEVTAPTEDSSAGVVPRAVGLCADLVPKQPAASLVAVECGAEYAVVSAAIESYQLEFGVLPASVEDLAPAFLAEPPVNWTLPPVGDPGGRTVVPAPDGVCVGSVD